MTHESDYAADDRPLVVCLHFLGGSARTWDAVAQHLDGVARCMLLDLAGFGDAGDVAGYRVADMVEAVAASVRAAAPRRWLLVGHSMGAKLAAVLARRAEDGESGLAGLAGLVLVAGSPPGPEPMADARRAAMLGWFMGHHDESRSQADGFIRASVVQALDGTAHERAVQDVLRENPAAWRAWLESGSREDWSSQVGRLAVPTLIIAGDDDADLGPDAQRLVMEQHFTHARLVSLADAGHLLPLERPDDVARLIASHVEATLPAPLVPASYRDLIDSDRVSGETRALLLARAVADDPAYQPRAIGAGQLAALRAVLDRVIPQPGRPIDLAARIDRQLAEGVGDGWRCAELPPDAEAYRTGLRTLAAMAGAPFESLPASRQDGLLQRIADGTSDPSGTGLFDPRQMKLWFEDVRSDATRLYVAHPATLARMGYSGIGYGGDGEPKPGFQHVGIGEREAWEPVTPAP